jgi:hypothetical protein
MSLLTLISNVSSDHHHLKNELHSTAAKKYVPRGGVPTRGVTRPPVSVAVVYNKSSRSRGGATAAAAQINKFGKLANTNLRATKRVQKIDRAPSLAISSEWEMVEVRLFNKKNIFFL